MIVAELIEQLQKLPGDLIVYVEGYEEGYDDIKQLLTGDFRRDVGDGLWSGPHYYYGETPVTGVALIYPDSGRL